MKCKIESIIRTWPICVPYKTYLNTIEATNNYKEWDFKYKISLSHQFEEKNGYQVEVSEWKSKKSNELHPLTFLRLLK